MSTRSVHRVRRMTSGDATAWSGGELTVSADEAAALVGAPCLADVRISCTSPGDRVRIVKVLDVVEPRTMGPGGGGIFPGWLGLSGPLTGELDHDVSDPGITLLRGAAVVVAGYLPRAQEAVIDMSGPAAELSPFGTTHNVVVEFTPAPGADWADVDDALRRGALALAARLAEAALGAPPDEEEPLPAPGAVDGLPRVGAITNLQTQGVFKDVFVRGKSFNGQPPTLIDPEEVDAGAVVSGQFGHPSLRNPTWVHQNHPVVNALRARHGRDLAFAGLVLSPEPVSAADKARVSAEAAGLCAEAGWQAVILTKEGGGNADADMSLKMDALEDMGIAAVGLFAEMAGPDGTGPPVVVPPERATAMVSTGNYDTRLDLPEMERALGGEELALLGVPATSAMELPTAVVLGSLSPLGWGRLTCFQEA
ncbi:MAG TPA: glycine/sarcosine/betaine reductase component B subunit [Acidimicrobiales bacterium]|nr:glycine/sarcosine/betaine reductase component B subunit [Acidimicrobiales bacterium]